MNKLNKEYKVLTNIAFNNIKEVFKSEKQHINFESAIKNYSKAMLNKDFLRLLEEEKDGIYEVIEKSIENNDFYEITEDLTVLFNDVYYNTNTFYNILNITFKDYLSTFINDFSDFNDIETYEHLERHNNDFYQYVFIIATLIENAIEEIDDEFIESIEGMTEQQIIEVYELNYSN